MVISNNTTDTKYKKNWKDEVERMSLIIGKEKQEEVKNYLVERTKINQEKEDLVKEKRKLEDEKKSLKSIYSGSRYLSNQKTEIENNRTAGDNLDDKWNRFANATGGAWDNGNNRGYTANEGWNNAIQKHYPATYKNNLYKFKNGNVEEEITEEQIINTVARIVKAFEKVNTDDFLAKYNDKESDTAKQNQVKTFLKEIQDQAPHIIVGSDKDVDENAKQRTYDFADTYQKFDKKTDKWTAYSPSAFNYQNFFDFIKLVQGQEFLNNLDAGKQKEVPASENWKVFLKDEEWDPEELADYGIILADKSKTTLYKSGSEFREFKVNQGIKGWIELANAITSDDNQTKITASFANSPQKKLVNDLKKWKFSHGTLQNTNFALGNPETLIDSAEENLDELNSKKIANALLEKELIKQIKGKQAEITAKQKELQAKEAEINQILQQILTKKREELIKHEISKGFKKTDDTDHRRPLSELYNIRDLLLEIRYLENDGDATQNSSESTENTALTDLQTILEKGEKLRLVDFFQRLAFIKGNEGKLDIQQAISSIKAGKFTNSAGKEEKIYDGLENFQGHFEALAEIVKLSDWELQALQAIKVAAGEQPDENEKLSDWQTKLKTLDNALDDTVINEDFKSKWNKINNFKNISQIEELLKKIISTDFFTTQQITDLKTLLGKEPKEVITLIIRYEYDKDAEEKKDKTVKVIKINMEKKKEDSLTEEEITDGLYKLAVGEYSQKTDAEIERWENGEEQKALKNFFRKDNPWMWGTIGLVAAIVAGIVYYLVRKKPDEESIETEIDKENIENEE